MDNYPDDVMNIPDDEKYTCNYCGYRGYASSYHRKHCIQSTPYYQHDVCPDCGYCLECGEFIEEE